MITDSRRQTIPIIKTATVLYSNTGKIIGAVETLKDISENISYKTNWHPSNGSITLMTDFTASSDGLR